MNFKTYNVLGVPLAELSYASAIQNIELALAQKKSSYVCVAAVHLLIEAQHNSTLLEGLQHSLFNTTDGMPLVGLVRLLGGKNAQRVYGPTLMQELCSLSETKKKSVFVLGGSKGQAQRVAQQILQLYPKLNIVGFQDTPNRLRTEKEQRIAVQKINQTKPDLVYVGSGCPSQELWMIQYSKSLPSCVCVGVGAAFQFLVGDIPQAPIWIQNTGLEWLFRVFCEPQRLWKRYTFTNIEFCWRVAKELLQNLL